VLAAWVGSLVRKAVDAVSAAFASRGGGAVAPPDEGVAGEGAEPPFAFDEVDFLQEGAEQQPLSDIPVDA